MTEPSQMTPDEKIEAAVVDIMKTGAMSRADAEDVVRAALSRFQLSQGFLALSEEDR